MKIEKIFWPAFVLIALITSYASASDGGDFEVFLEAARRLSPRLNIYAPPFIRGLQYYYSIFFALLLSPLSNHVFLGDFLWLMLSWFFMYRTVMLALSYFPSNAAHSQITAVGHDILTKKQHLWWTLLVLLLSLQFIKYNISLIQITFFLLWAILESTRLIEERKFITGGILLAVAINIKVMPIIMLAYLFYRGYFKAITVCIVSCVALLYLPALFIGFDYNNFLLSEWWKVINPSNQEHMFETNIGTNSLSALIPVYLTPTEGEMPFRRHIFSLSPGAVQIILSAARLAMLALSLLFLRTLPFRKEGNKLKTYWELSYFILIIPLVLPHQNKYNLLLSVPMLAYLCYYFIVTYALPKTTTYKIALGIFIAAGLFYSPLYGSDILGTFLFRYTQHYRFLTIATLLIIPVALYCNPEKLKEFPSALQQSTPITVPD